MRPLEDVLKEVLWEVLGVDQATITAETRLRADLDADSLDMVEILMGAEERLGIEIDDAAFNKTGEEWRDGDVTFEQLVAEIKKYQEAA